MTPIRSALFAIGLVMLPAGALAAPPEFWGDGVHDDADALEAIFEGCPVLDRSATQNSRGRVQQSPDSRTTFLLSANIKIRREVRAYKRKGVLWVILSSIMIEPNGKERIIERTGSDQLLGAETEPQPCPAPTS